MTDIAKARREGMRWNIINTLNQSRPYSMVETFLLDILRAIYPDTTPLELRRELDYLADRALVDLTKDPGGSWAADLSRIGVDVAEYTVDVEAGIARPPRYWSA